MLNANGQPGPAASVLPVRCAALRQLVVIDANGALALRTHTPPNLPAEYPGLGGSQVATADYWGQLVRIMLAG